MQDDEISNNSFFWSFFAGGGVWKIGAPGGGGKYATRAHFRTQDNIPASLTFVEGYILGLHPRLVTPRLVTSCVTKMLPLRIRAFS